MPLFVMKAFFLCAVVKDKAWLDKCQSFTSAYSSAWASACGGGLTTQMILIMWPMTFELTRGRGCQLIRFICSLAARKQSFKRDLEAVEGFSMWETGWADFSAGVTRPNQKSFHLLYFTSIRSAKELILNWIYITSLTFVHLTDF